MASPVKGKKDEGSFLDGPKKAMGGMMSKMGKKFEDTVNKGGWGKTAIGVGMVGVAVIATVFFMHDIANLTTPMNIGVTALLVVVGGLGLFILCSTESENKITEMIKKVFKLVLPLIMAACFIAIPACFMASAIPHVTVGNFFLTLTGPVGLLALQPNMCMGYIIGMLFTLPCLVCAAGSLGLFWKHVEETANLRAKPLLLTSGAYTMTEDEKANHKPDEPAAT